MGEGLFRVVVAILLLPFGREKRQNDAQRRKPQQYLEPSGWVARSPIPTYHKGEESLDREGECLGELNEKCGVFGAFTASRYAQRLTYYGLWALQHRGQEGSGIVSSNGTRLLRHAGPGLVAHVYAPEDLDRLKGHMAIGHNRYSTSGAGGGAHVQPILHEEGGFALAHNGNLPSTTALEQFLTKQHIAHGGLNDSGMMVAAIAYYIRHGKSLAESIEAAWPLFTGAFSCVAMDATTVVGFRDECGIRPLSLGRLEDGFAIASETCAFDTVGAAFLRDIKPGELVTISAMGVKSRQVVKSRTALDVFEYVYFARPDSMVMGRKVNEVRRQLGKNLAKEFPLKADVVIPVPDSAIPAALGYAEATGIRFDHGFIKNRYIHRTFIRPTQVMRERDVKTKLNPVPEVVMGKDVVVVDDSIVRGTTTMQLVDMLYGAGARKVHVLVSSPPVKFPDFYGINTPNPDDLIASRLSVEEIRQHIGAESLGYLSYEGMVRATGWPKSKLSTSCFDGVYPISIGERAQSVAVSK
ncbi:MAG: amidophosphoribosyltransferase [Patescibacteria group bacterium]|nr:amidophosphoribosyltransferase [Patescibacteria group bacterium]